MPTKSKTPEVILERLNQFMKYSEEHHTNHERKMDEVIEQVKFTNGKVIKNTEYRIKAEATITLGKYIIGLLGFSNIALIINAVRNLI